MHERTDRPPPDHQDEIHRRGALVLQTLPIVLIPVGVSLVAVLLVRLFVAPPPGLTAPNPAWPILILVVFFSALILLVRLRRTTVSALALIGMWTLVTVIATVRSGVSSNMVALLVVPICVAGLLIDAVASVSLAALATILVVCLAWLEAQGLAAPISAPVIPPELTALVSAAFWVGLFWTVAALTSLLSRGLYRALRESRQRAAELRQLSDELEARVQAQTAQLLAQAQERAVLEERARLSREIHDTIAQGLAGVAVQLGAARQGLGLLGGVGEPGLIAAVAENMSIAEHATRETLAEARRSVWNLRAPQLARGGLSDALEAVGAHAVLPVEVRVAGQAWPLAPAVESALLRVAQEALANTVKHAAAAAATIGLTYTETSVALQVCDNGVGFPPEVIAQRAAPASPWGGFGLLGMEERVHALGGELQLSTVGGACVSVRVPRSSAELPVPSSGVGRGVVA
jgi:signal transduction histidine kinase